MIKIMIVADSKETVIELGKLLQKHFPKNQVTITGCPSYKALASRFLPDISLQNTAQIDLILGHVRDGEGETFEQYVPELHHYSKRTKFIFFSKNVMLVPVFQKICKDYEGFGVHPHCLSFNPATITATALQHLL